MEKYLSKNFLSYTSNNLTYKEEVKYYVFHKILLGEGDMVLNILIIAKSVSIILIILPCDAFLYSGKHNNLSRYIKILRQLCFPGFFH
jgi:hypothetical protein